LFGEHFPSLVPAPGHRRLSLIDEFNVLENGGIVERRFASALDFIVAEDESLVFPDRTSDRRAELILP